MAEDGKAIVTEFIKAGAELRADDLIAMMSDDCECWFTGGGSLSRDQLAQGVRMLLGAAVGPGPVIINDIIQEGDKIAVEYENKFPLRNGRFYHNHYHTKFEVKGGKITVMREYLDSAHVADVLAGIAPHVAA